MISGSCKVNLVYYIANKNFRNNNQKTTAIYLLDSTKKAFILREFHIGNRLQF